MQTFLEYYKQLNENLNLIPTKVIGLSNNIKLLPDKRPYGFWMSKSGNFIPVGYEDHSSTAYLIVSQALQYYKETGETPPELLTNTSTSGYRKLFKHNWCRIVTNYEPTLYYELGSEMQLTPSQKRTIDAMMEKYGLTVLERDG